MAEARAVKLFTQFSYSYQKNKNHPKRGVVMVMWPI